MIFFGGGHMIIWLCVVLPMLIVLLVSAFLRAKDRRKEENIHDKVARAVKNITADGKVEGPKGPYVPHKPWSGVGHAPLSDHETKPPSQGGYYGKG